MAQPDDFDPTHALDGWRAPAPAPLDLDLRSLHPSRSAAVADAKKQAWMRQHGYQVQDVEDVEVRVPPPTPVDPAPGLAPLLTVEGGVARITLRRPRQANRLAVEDLDTLRRLLAEVDANDAVRVLVLAGEGRHFCAGFDLGALGAIDAGARFGELADALEAARPITIARLHGGAYGGAADLALACDFRLGGPAVEMFVPAARIGLHFYAGGLQRFVNRLGLATAKQVLLAGRTFDAQALLDVGYLDQLLPDVATLDAALQTLLDELLGMAPLALLPMKQHLNAIAAGRLDAARLQADIVRARDSADLVEGQAAWAGKRPARFEGG